MKLPRKVYLIRHDVTGRVYIGSSADIETRYMNHMYALRAGNHPVEDMQKDFDEYGEKFTFTVVDEITTMDECEKEYEWMREFKSYVRGVGYNYKDHVFTGKPKVPQKPKVHRKESEKEKHIRKINDLMQKTSDDDLLELVYLLLKQSAEECA